MNEDVNYNQKNNSKKILIIICVIVIIFAFLFLKLIKTDKTVESNNLNNDIDIQSPEENTINDINTDNSGTDTNINYNTDDYNATVSSDINLSYDENGAFLMAIEDIFNITGRGLVVTGKIQRGTINVNDTVQIIGLSDEIKTAEIIGVEEFRENIDTATVGDNVGLVLKNVTKNDLEVGQVLAQPNSIKNVKKFDAQVHMLTEDENGIQTPLLNGYNGQFYFRTTNIAGVVELPSNIQSVKAGDTTNMTIELTSPVAMEIGTEFSITEDGRTIGNGTITKIY